jgi:hypothetical protein
MPTAEQYRKSADQCRRVAGNTEDRHEREAVLRIAAQWDRLAEHKERKEAEKSLMAEAQIPGGPAELPLRAEA